MTVTEFPDLGLAREQAADWIARLDRGLDADERRELRHWCAATPANTRALRQFSGVWADLDVMKALAEVFPEGLPADSAEQPAARARRARPALAAGVAIGLVLAGGGAWVMQQREAGSAQSLLATLPSASYSTAVGEQREVALADGSALSINTASQVELLRLDDAVRELRLKRGEAHFKVAKDPTRPFRVAVGGHVVEAVGTAFDIRLHDGGAIDVVVTEGRVRLLADDTEASHVDVGHAVHIATDGSALHRRIDEQQLLSLLAWQRGMIEFRGQPLSEALAEFQRYTPARFLVADAAVATRPIGGSLPAGDVDSLLEALRTNFGFESSRGPDGIIRITAGR